MSRDPSAARFDLANGWTLSICPDSRPAICLIAAWPTNDVAPSVADMKWFKFSDGQRDRRCWDAQDIINAVAEVAAAPVTKGVFS